MKTIVAAALLALSTQYFDAHNHIAGILPYYAYANLPAYVGSFSDPASTSASPTDSSCSDTSPTCGIRPTASRARRPALFSTGRTAVCAGRARDAGRLQRFVEGNAVDIDGALERVLSATPWTEFDCAYAFRGGPVMAYLASRFYAGDDRRS